jgi:trehalose/maltose transport system substrate-binding protein
MKRRSMAIVGLFVIMTLLLAACGGGAAPAAEAPAAEAPAAEAPAEEAPAEEAAPTEAPAEEAAPTEAPAEEPAAEEAPAEGVVTLTWVGPGPGAEFEFRKEQAERWNAANPDIQVRLIEGPVSATDRYGLYLQAFQAQSTDIDVMQIDVIWPGDLAEHLIDFNEYGGAEAVAGDFPAIVQNNTVDGRLVGLPWFTDGGLLYYRSDLLEKYGFSGPPATWDELEQMAQTIQDGERAEGNQDFWGYVWQGAPYEGLTCDALEWVYSSGGGTIISPDKLITINNEAAAAALDQAASWVGTISPPGVTSFMEEESRRVWHGGNAAFMRNWPYAYGLSEGEDSAVAGKFDATSLPGAEAGMSAATLGGWQVGTGIEPELADPDQGRSLRGCRHCRQSSVHAQAAAGLHQRSGSPVDGECPAVQRGVQRLLLQCGRRADWEAERHRCGCDDGVGPAGSVGLRGRRSVRAGPAGE